MRTRSASSAPACPPGRSASATSSSGGAYVRYILTSAVDGADIPLVVAVDKPQGEGTDQVATLMQAAFHELDRNSDRVLDPAEFGVR